MASAFGVGTALAISLDSATPRSVNVGGVITVHTPSNYGYDTKDESIKVFDINDNEVEGYVVYLSGPIYIEGKGTYWNFRALKPGTIKFQVSCHDKTNSVTITPRSLPMHSIMKILGFGGLMRE